MPDDADALLAQVDAQFVAEMTALDAEIDASLKDHLGQEAALRKEYSDVVVKRIEHPVWEQLNGGSNNGTASPASSAAAIEKPA